MKVLLITFACLASAAAYALPQYSYPVPTTQSSPQVVYPTRAPYVPVPECRAGGGRPVATCSRRQSSPGVYDFICEVNNECDITIQREDILWLRGERSGEQINVVVPNYKLEEVIKAAFKSTPGGATGVNILLKRPQITAEAEVDERQPPRGEPEVNLEYEPVPPRQSVHYPVDRNYRPLSGPIREP